MHTIVLSTAEPIQHVLPEEKVSIECIDYEFYIMYLEREETNEITAVADSLLPAPKPQSPDNILNILCDDVLRLIFVDPRFDVMQLMEIANVCMRFQSIAGEIFTSKYTGKIDLCDVVGRHVLSPIWMVAEFIHAFGPLIATFNLGATCPSIALQLVANGCPEIEEIICRRYGRYAECVLPAIYWPKLAKLQLYDMAFDDVTAIQAFFAMNAQLEQLILDDVVASFHLMRICRLLPNLGHLTLCPLQHVYYHEPVPAIDFSIKSIRHTLDECVHVKEASFAITTTDATIDFSDMDAIDRIRKSRPINLKIRIRLQDKSSLLNHLQRLYGTWVRLDASGACVIDTFDLSDDDFDARSMRD